MATYDEIRSLVADVTDAEKLSILRSESMRILGVLQGFSHIVYELVAERGVPEMPDDFAKWCEIIANSSDNLAELIYAVTDWEDRSEKIKRDQELNQRLWRDVQAGLPELTQYSSLRQAIEQYAAQLGFSFENQQMKTHDAFTIVFYWCEGRSAHIGPQRKTVGREYIGYSMMLGWITDVRNEEGENIECLAPSFKEAVEVLHHWLIEHKDLSELIEKYRWLRSN